MPTKNANLLFYQGEIPAEPEGIFLDDIHSLWYYDLPRLESNHNYIQWLFPNRESGRNRYAQALQAEEAAAIRNDPSMMRRFIRSYEMMLHFYGMRLLDRDSGKVTRGTNWEEQFKNLNFSEHNFLRITRILKTLGELGLERYKAPLLRFLLTEAIEHCTLQNTLDSCHKYWIPTLRDVRERQDLIKHAETLAKARQSSQPKKSPEPRFSSLRQAQPANRTSKVGKRSPSPSPSHEQPVPIRRSNGHDRDISPDRPYDPQARAGRARQEQQRLQRHDQLPQNHQQQHNPHSISPHQQQQQQQQPISLRQQQQPSQHGQQWMQRQSENFPPLCQLQPYQRQQHEPYPPHLHHQPLQQKQQQQLQ